MARYVQTCDGPDPATAVCVWESPDLLVFSGTQLAWSDVGIFIAACWTVLAVAWGIKRVTRLMVPRG